MRQWSGSNTKKVVCLEVGVVGGEGEELSTGGHKVLRGRDQTKERQHPHSVVTRQCGGAVAADRGDFGVLEFWREGKTCGTSVTEVNIGVSRLRGVDVHDGYLQWVMA